MNTLTVYYHNKVAALYIKVSRVLMKPNLVFRDGTTGGGGFNFARGKD